MQQLQVFHSTSKTILAKRKIIRELDKAHLGNFSAIYVSNGYAIKNPRPFVVVTFKNVAKRNARKRNQITNTLKRIRETLCEHVDIVSSIG